MSTYLGSTLLAGSSTETKLNAHSLFDFKFTDHKLNELSWLRADTFSWQSGDVYVDAYNHLSTELLTATENTETIGSYTITYYQATDGHKLILPNMISTLESIYAITGVAWYYVVDTTNTRFKLPRTKHGFSGLRDEIGKYISAGLPNIVGTLGSEHSRCYIGRDETITGAFTTNSASASSVYTGSYGKETGRNLLNFDASNSNAIYGNSDTVQPPATQMYLYFYVGEFSQSSVEQIAGGVQEMVESKADLDLANTGRITNCITEIPQDIKLELNSGVLTLKAGSNVYMPNGVGVFTKCTNTTDCNYSPTWGAGYQCLVMGWVNASGALAGIGMCRSDLHFSGTTAPTASIGGTVWYDTSVNKIKVWRDSVWHVDEPSEARVLPLGIVTVGTGNVITSIDCVFNGFGYIGSTVFVLPGVKGLFANGRNSDNTLKSTELTRGSVLTNTYTTETATDVWFNLQANGIGGLTNGAYDEYNNYLIKSTNGNKQYGFVFAKADLTSGKIVNWIPNTVFHSLNYSDKNIIAGFAMPSNKYTDLTIGASRSSYTAPANGYFMFTLRNGSTGYVGLDNNLAEANYGLVNYQYATSSSLGRVFIPAKKGDVVFIEFTSRASDTTRDKLRFFYCEGDS